VRNRTSAIAALTLALIAVMIASVLALLASPKAAGATRGSNPKLILITKCGTGSNRPNKTFTGRSTIIDVRGKGCATVDRGAIARAYDHSLVAAHGNSAVIGYGHATLIIYNSDVTCATHGSYVSVIYANAVGVAECRHFKK
jgi:hypothetical protein